MRALLPILVLAVGCAPTAPPASIADAAACNAAAIADRVGRPLAEAPVATLQKATGARAARLIRPGTIVTMDYRPDRLNVEVDAADVITALRCG